MGDVKGFLRKRRIVADFRPVCERVRDYKHASKLKPFEHSQDQASRCMDCGTPFCHWGCPLGNHIPEWNDLVYRGRWKEAYEILDATNALPEITGLVCPAPCEWSCVLGINDEPVTVKDNERAVIEYAFRHDLVKPKKSPRSFDERIAIIGSGPAGLSCASFLARTGYNVTVYERDEKPGGLLRFGIPDFKLEKRILDRRLEVMEKEGVTFKCSVEVGRDVSLKKVKEDHDIICLTGGSRVARDLDIEGRDLKGIHFAMDYLSQANRRVSGLNLPESELIDAKNKNVVIIGGGDTGSDCVGVANRQKAKCVKQIELLERPDECRNEKEPWPFFPRVLSTSSSHEEGVERKWAILTKKFLGEKGSVKKLACQRVEFVGSEKNKCPEMRAVEGSDFEIDADLVVFAMGFVHPEKAFFTKDMFFKTDERGHIKTDDKYRTSQKDIYASGDMRRGQSLVVWAVAEGLNAARSIHEDLREK